MELNGVITLEKNFFTTNEKTLFKSGKLKAFTFIYDTGIRALRLENESGYLIGLPFRGQQIWDVCFKGRNIGTKSMFDQPKNVESFINTYICFFSYTAVHGGWDVPDPGTSIPFTVSSHMHHMTVQLLLLEKMKREDSSG